MMRVFARFKAAQDTVKHCAILLVLATTIALAQAPPDVPGTLVYTRVVGQNENNFGTSEVHLIDPDGSNDRMIWSGPRGLSTISPSAAIRPDGGEIGFINAHEFACSRFDSDVYLMQLDGSNLRRITNAPKCDDLAQRPQGSVTVTIENHTVNTFGIFAIYIDGATNMPEITLPWNTSRTFTIDHVADFDTEQFIYAKGGEGTWFNPAAYAQVEPGQTVTATSAVEITSGLGPYQLRINEFSWNGDGSEIAYIVEAGLRETITTNPAPLQRGSDVFSANNNLVSTALTWSPVNDDFLYFSQYREPNGIYRGARGTDAANHELVLETDFIVNIDWLPDASGFVLSTNGFGFFENGLWQYDFASGQATKLLGGTNIFGIVLSPDARYFAYAERANENSPFDLWGRSIDGSQKWLIVSDILSWDWGPTAGGPPPPSGVELAYDDGTPTTSYTWPAAGQGSAVRFTPPSGTAKLLQAKIFISSVDGGNEHALRVLGDNGGTPGGTIAGPFTVSAPSTGWVTYDLSSAGISVNGDFYVMLEYTSANAPAFGSENRPPLNQRSWDFDGSLWTLFDSEDYLFRTVVETATGVAVLDGHSGVPLNFEVSQNFPNPFNPATEIPYSLPQAAFVTLKVFDMLGREVATLVEEYQQAGMHSWLFAATEIDDRRRGTASGVYFYRLTASDNGSVLFTATRKMVLVE